MTGFSSDLVDIVTGVWWSELGVRVAPLQAGGLLSSRAPVWAGIVRIRGAWEGAVVLECGDSMMTQMPGDPAAAPPPLLGDLALKIGEGFSVLLPGRCVLGPPETILGQSGRPLVPNTVAVLSAEFAGPGWAFSVTVLQRRPALRP